MSYMRILILVAIIAVVAATFLLRKRREQVPEQEFATTQDLIAYLSAEAVKDASENSHIQLDYSVESIKKVEGTLADLHERYRKDNSSVSAQALAAVYGAYIGESIRRSDSSCADGSCKWEQDHPIAGAKSYPLHWAGSESFPMAWCYKRIVDGPEDNVWVKFSVIRDGHQKKKSDSTGRTEN